MHKQEPVCTGGERCRSRFACREVPARPLLHFVERRLAQEDVCSGGELHERGGRSCVGRERRDLAVRLDAETERRLGVVRDAPWDDREPGRFERAQFGVLLDLEHVVESRCKVIEIVAAAGREPQLRRFRSGRRHVQLTPQPGGEVAAVVDVRCVIAIASTAGHHSTSRRRERTPGPQSTRRRPPSSCSKRYPEAPCPGLARRASSRRP